MRVVCLAGGVGGAKLADGLQQVLAPGELTVVVNTGDDFERHSLLICPDHDTVAYTLAGVADPVQGWGLADETWQVMDQLARLGQETWFRIGDRDLATHLFRAERRGKGVRLTQIALELQKALGVPSRVLPMTDEQVRTRVRTDDGWLDFQDYFVRLRQVPEVRDVRYEGAESSAITPEVRAAIQAADTIVVAPSNPVVSIGPILAIPGFMEEIASARHRGVRVVGVSGIVGGKAVRGPADRMLASLGEESSALGVARRYASIGLLDAFVIDRADESMADEIRSLGLEVAVADTIMTDVPDRGRLAREMLVLARASGAAA
ncbi:MAG TPA: 2-phospho-L-lactate transferase [Candidatus Limnocylindrales bacterium]